jgi:hypothetical protein
MKKPKKIKKVGLKLPNLQKCQSVQLHFTPQAKRSSNRMLSVPDLLKNKPEAEDINYSLFQAKSELNQKSQTISALKTKNLQLEATIT